MITEICKLHSKLTNDTEIVIKLAGDERQTVIQKDDILKKVDDHTLKVTRPPKASSSNGTIRLINLDYAMIAYYGRRTLL